MKNNKDKHSLKQNINKTEKKRKKGTANQTKNYKKPKKNQT